MHINYPPPENSTDDLPPGLLRQRRNLLIISLSLIAYEVGEGQFTGVSVSGLGLAFGNPGVLHFLAWAVFIYQLWRFTVYADIYGFGDFDGKVWEIINNTPSRPLLRGCAIKVYEAAGGDSN